MAERDRHGGACRVPTPRGSPRRARVLARLRRARRPAGGGARRHPPDASRPAAPLVGGRVAARRGRRTRAGSTRRRRRRARCVASHRGIRTGGARHRRSALARRPLGRRARVRAPATPRRAHRRARREPDPPTPGTGSVPGLRRCSGATDRGQADEPRGDRAAASAPCRPGPSAAPAPPHPRDLEWQPTVRARDRPRVATGTPRAHVRGASPHPGRPGGPAPRPRPAPAGCDTFGAADLLRGVASHGRARRRSVGIIGRSPRTGRGGRDRRGRWRSGRLLASAARLGGLPERLDQRASCRAPTPRRGHPGPRGACAPPGARLERAEPRPGRAPGSGRQTCARSRGSGGGGGAVRSRPTLHAPRRPRVAEAARHGGGRVPLRGGRRGRSAGARPRAEVGRAARPRACPDLHLLSNFSWNDVNEIRGLLESAIAETSEEAALADVHADLGYVEILGGHLRSARSTGDARSSSPNGRMLPRR